MKKLAFLLVLATTFIACNNAADNEARMKDSLDSVANAKKEMIDSTAEQKKETVDSVVQQQKEAVDKMDSVTH